MCTRIDWWNKQDLKAAGNLIKTEIQEQIYTNEYYPSTDDIAVKNWIPYNLQKLLWVLIQSEVTGCPHIYHGEKSRQYQDYQK